MTMMQILAGLGSGAQGIVTSSLSLNLDAGNSSSYPGSGTTWSDISGNGYTGTMTNISYNSGSGGYMTFNGSSSYMTVNMPKPSSMPISFDFWIYPDTSTPAGLYDSAPNNADVLRQYDDANVNGRAEWWNKDPTISLGLSATAWQHIVLIYSFATNRTITYYRNGSLISTTTGGTSSTFSWTTLNFGRINNGSPFYAGRVSTIKIYTKALSSTEVTQNYNAIKSRYGL